MLPRINMLGTKLHKFGTSASWEGNRRSGVALAMRHRQLWYYQLQAHGLRKGDEHPAYAPVENGIL